MVTKTTKSKSVKKTGVVTAEAQHPAERGSVRIEFTRVGARQVSIAGSFNQWIPDKMPLSTDGQGKWMGSLSLPPGRHEYLFVVDGQWLPDPNAAEVVPNPFGGINSVLSIGA